MLKNILAISGKPGLYKLISRGNNMIIVESLIDKKRTPSHARDRVISLGDISMYTDTDDVPLRTVLQSMKELEQGKTASVSPKAAAAELREYLAKVLPEFDRDRVHDSDIKKLIQWYNLLIESGNDDFSEPEEGTQDNAQ